MGGLGERLRDGVFAEPMERLECFYGMLRTRTSALSKPSEPSEKWSRLQVLLADEGSARRWNRAYEAEQILCWLIPDDDVVETFNALETEARQSIDRDVVKERREQFDSVVKANAKDYAGQRIALQALAEDLHEHWAEEDEKISYASRITERTAVVLLGSLVLLFVCAVGLSMRWYLGDWLPSRIPKFALLPAIESKRLFCLVLSAGLFGASLSMATGIRARLEAASLNDLEKMFPWVNVIARCFIGASAGVVLFILCVSGLLAGNAMPPLGDASKPLTTVALAHLVGLCIVAGFSEKFIPNVLTKVESRSELSADEVAKVATKAAEKAVADKTAADKTATEKAAAEKTAAAKAAADKSAAAHAAGGGTPSADPKR